MEYGMGVGEGVLSCWAEVTSPQGRARDLGLKRIYVYIKKKEKKLSRISPQDGHMQSFIP